MPARAAQQVVTEFFSFLCPGARFSKVPILFGSISGDMILFLSSKRRRLEAQNFAVALTFIPFTTYEKTRPQLFKGWIALSTG